MDLVGRRAERELVGDVLARASAGQSQVLVVRGEPGIGKTALLTHAQDTASRSGFRVETSVGIEAEAQFAFAALHQLCTPLDEHVAALPQPQQAALGVAFGRRSGPAPDRFLVGLAVLHLLAEAAEEHPLLCVVDDVQWLDQASAQVLAFVARRLGAERIALVLAARDLHVGDVDPFAGLPDMRLDGLGPADAQTLLGAAVLAPLDAEVLDRVLAEARGNPLALLELPRDASTMLQVGGLGLPDALSASRRVEDGFRERSATLAKETQLLLLAAAAEPTGEAELLWRATERLGVPPEAAGPAEAAGLVELGTRVRFRHPLVRSAVYRAAPAADRRLVHGALADATDPGLDPERHAWHRAQAVTGTDEAAAEALERSADRARTRGGLAAAGTFLQRAAELSPDPAARAGRALEAAHVMHDAGASEAAEASLRVAADGPLVARDQARLERLRALVAFHLTRDAGVPRTLVGAATTLAPLDPALSRETYLYALEAAIVNGGDGLRQVAEAARAAPVAPAGQNPADLLLDGLVATHTEEYETGALFLRRALEAFSREESTPADAGRRGETVRWLWLATRTAATLFEDDMVCLLAEQNVRLARTTGALATLPAALVLQSITLVLRGELGRAAELSDEGVSISRATGAVPSLQAQLMIGGWRGRPDDRAEILRTLGRAAPGPRHDTEVSMAQYALAVLHNAHGNYPAAHAAARQASESLDLTQSHMTLWEDNVALPELVEAASRAGEAEHARAGLERLSSRADATRTDWALGLAAYSRALVTTGAGAEDHYHEAVERLGRCRMAVHLARTHLAYGEWLRRQDRRQDARDQLHTAHEMLSTMGAAAFAARAARELRATGEHVRKRGTQPSDALTAHEAHIARLVATGATSREVAAELFLSPRTVEAHLRSIFQKLGITSRRQLRELRLS